MGQGVLSRYGEYLPLTRSTPMITIGEGSTPLVRSRTIEKELGVGRLYFKLEGCNPTGSFKDRGMVVAVAKALEANAEAIMLCLHGEHECLGIGVRGTVRAGDLCAGAQGLDSQRQTLPGAGPRGQAGQCGRQFSTRY